MGNDKTGNAKTGNAKTKGIQWKFFMSIGYKKYIMAE